MPGRGPQQCRLSYARLAKHDHRSAMLTDLVDQAGQGAQLPVPAQQAMRHQISAVIRAESIGDAVRAVAGPQARQRLDDPVHPVTATMRTRLRSACPYAMTYLRSVSRASGRKP